METQLFQFNSHPNDIAITKTKFLLDGLLFLDFRRPLKRIRWFGVLNRWFGFTVALSVPVVHQGEHQGDFVIGIHTNDPNFKNVLALWKEHYPTKRNPPETKAEGFKIIGDFALQFPNECKPC